MKAVVFHAIGDIRLEDLPVSSEPGKDVRNLDIGDRAFVCSTIACGTCSYCRTGCNGYRAPSQGLQRAVGCIANAGTLGMIGVCLPQGRTFPTGVAMNRNRAINAGKCHRRRYVPMPVDRVRSGKLEPVGILSLVHRMADRTCRMQRRSRRWSARGLMHSPTKARIR